MTEEYVSVLSDMFRINYLNYQNNLDIIKNNDLGEKFKLLSETNDLFYDVLDTVLEIFIIGGASEK